jgi:hypothetical protein
MAALAATSAGAASMDILHRPIELQAVRPIVPIGTRGAAFARTLEFI